MIKSLIDKILGKLKAERAKDLSDLEITRCLSGCVDKRLVEKTKSFRDTNLISVENLK